MTIKKERLVKLILFVLPILFIWQGLDFSDMGFMLTNALFFAQPGIIQDQGLAYFLTNAMGWLWLKFSSPFGLIGARFGWCVIIWSILWCSNNILRSIMPETRSLLFLIITFLLSLWGTWVSYNDLSALFALLTIFFIIKSQKQFCTKVSYIYMFIGGAFTGLNIFIRLPNLIMLCFAFIPMAAYILSEKRFPHTLIYLRSMFFLLGTASAIALVLVGMKLSGYLPYYLTCLSEIKDLAQTDASHHSIIALLTLFKTDHIYMYSLTFKFLSKILFLSFIFSLIFRNKAKYIILLPLLYFFLKIYIRITSFKDCIYILAGILYSFILIRIYYASFRHNISNLYIFLSALGLFMCVPMGSNNGLYNIVTSSWLMLPLAFDFLFLSLKPVIIENRYLAPVFRFLPNNQASSMAFYMRYLIIFSFIYISINHAWIYTYRDSQDRFSMKYEVNSIKLLNNVYTTYPRATVIHELLNELCQHINKYDYLLTYDVAGTLHYVTGTKPYLYSAWPYLFEPKLFNKKLKKAEQNHTLPIIVKSKATLLNSDWPVSTYLDNEPRYAINRNTLNNFLKKYSYKLIWENSLFQIWLPPS